MEIRVLIGQAVDGMLLVLDMVDLSLLFVDQSIQSGVILHQRLSGEILRMGQVEV